MIFHRPSNSGNLSVTLIISGVLLVVGSTFLLLVLPGMMKPATNLWLGDGLFKTELALNESARTKGLSGVSSLDPDQALLMAYPTEGKWGIWMKDMKIPIDVIWLDKDKKVVSIVKNFEPDDVLTRYPVSSAQYVIELPAGTVDKKSIDKDDTATFQVDEKGIK